MAKTAKKTKAVMGYPLVMGRDMPLCIVRPIFESVKRDNPDFPEELIRGTLASISLDLGEMQRLFDASQLADFQIEALIETFADEQKEFVKLLSYETTDVVTLQAKMLMEAFLIAACRGHAVPLQLERALIARIVKRVLRRGMAPVLNGISIHWWKYSASSVAILVWRHAFPPEHPIWLRSKKLEHDSQNEI